MVTLHVDTKTCTWDYKKITAHSHWDAELA